MKMIKCWKCSDLFGTERKEIWRIFNKNLTTMVLEHNLFEIQDRYFIQQPRLTLLIVLDSYRCNFSYQRGHKLCYKSAIETMGNTIKIFKGKLNIKLAELIQSIFLADFPNHVCDSKLLWKSDFLAGLLMQSVKVIFAKNSNCKHNTNLTPNTIVFY